jgi:cell division protein FtsB
VAIAFFVEGGLGDVQQLQARKKALNESIESKRQTLLNLKEREKRLHQDPYLIEKLARKKLGYGRPGEKRVKLAGDGDTTPAKKSGNENVPEAWKSGE